MDIRRAADHHLILGVIEDMHTDKAELFVYYWLALTNGKIEYEREHNFDKHLGRKHRFDFAFPEHMVAVEIEGNAWGVKGGGRHMQNSDLEKYNIAAGLGWRIFRFSPSMLKSDPTGCVKIVAETLECLTNKTLLEGAVISANVDAGAKDTMPITRSSTTSKRKAGQSTKNSTTRVTSSL